jgi:5-methylcytosine-specific restriction endonuclease McrA
MGKSKFDEITKEKLQLVVSESTCQSEVLAKLGFANSSPNNYKKLRMLFDKFEITPTFRKRKANELSLDAILITGSTYNRQRLVARLVSAGLITYSCDTCGGDGTWQGAPITLELDHINGISNDNRLDNLRLLCPNCHSQTETFRGRNRGGKDPRQNITFVESRVWTCEKCEKEISYGCKRCSACVVHDTKIDWPSDDELILMVQRSNFVQAGKALGVTDNAIRKRLRRRGYIINRSSSE